MSPERRYLPTFADLIDRLSIVQLKAIFISEHAEEYRDEMALIMHDIDLILEEKMPHRTDAPGLAAGGLGSYSLAGGPLTDLILRPPVNATMLRAAMVVMLANRYIWENETLARAGGSQQDKLLKLTHSINGVRNTAKNVISHALGERRDWKVDCFAGELAQEFGNWDVFSNGA